ncbi:uncharacterized protein LOC123294863 [Chrysoperla carnea]|uniref:uncharacterized protein LOC123294863 n=1 Tax=Chrysoperla carnea TaxID=189513 RepID=UPI001D089E85|nr:uncharacterized protein LOC123294863 [Chrysoperla carnea]
MALSITSAERAITDGHPCSKEYLERIMREYEKDETFTIKKMTSSKALNEGDNYIAEFFRVKIEAVITVDGTEKEIVKSVIVKKPYRDEKNVPPSIFKFESMVYNNVLNNIEKTFESKLPVIQSIRADEGIVVTEDFRDGGWMLSNRREGMNQQQTEQVMKALAKFHAASIVLSVSQSDKFQELSQYVQDQVYSKENEEVCKKTLADSYEITRYFAEEYLPKANVEEATVIKKFMKYTSDEMYIHARKATNETPHFAKVFVHGDCWANNIMLKEDGSGDHALLINISTVCLTSPARDLVYVFATNSQQVNKTALIQVYVQELHKHLIAHKISEDVIKQFSTEFIESEVKRLEIVALLTSMWLLVPISYTSFPTVEEYNKAERKDKPKLVGKHIDKEFYTRRLVEVLLEYAK